MRTPIPFKRYFRPPDIHVGGLMFYHGFFLLLSSFFRQLPTELAERNSTISGHMAESKCNLKMHVWNVGYPFPIQISGPKPPFPRFRNLKAHLTAYIFGTKHIIRKQASALQTPRVSYIVSKRHELWSTNGFKLEVSFHPPSINSAFHFIIRLRRRRSAYETKLNKTLPDSWR